MKMKMDWHDGWIDSGWIDSGYTGQLMRLIGSLHRWTVYSGQVNGLIDDRLVGLTTKDN